MKICGDNIQNLYLVKSKKYLKDKKNEGKYVERGSCKNCGEMFLGQISSTSNYCSKSCAASEKNNNKGKGGYRKRRIPTYDNYYKKLEKYHDIRKCPYDKNILEVKCCECGNYHIPELGRVVDRIRGIEMGKGSESKFYCSEECKDNNISFGMKKHSKLISKERDKERMRNYKKENIEYLKKHEKHYHNSFCLGYSKKRKKLEKYYKLINENEIVGIECEKCKKIFWPTVSRITYKLNYIKKNGSVGFLCKDCDKLNYNNRSRLEDHIYDIINEKLSRKFKILQNDDKTILNPQTGGYLELDLYIPEIKKAIEVSSKKGHDNEKVKKRDEIKKQECKKIDIDLITIGYEEYNIKKNNVLNKLDIFLEDIGG